MDVWNAQQMAQNLTAAGLEVWEVKQTMTGMAETTKKLEMLVLAQSIGHGASSAAVDGGQRRCSERRQREYQTAQGKSRNKIDGVVATSARWMWRFIRLGFCRCTRGAGCWRYEVSRKRR